MKIIKCTEKEITRTGEFYDSVVKWLDEHINYPKWIYKEYPSLEFVSEMVKKGCQYICLEDNEIIGAFSVDSEPQGSYDDAKWSHDLEAGSYLIIHALAIDPEAQGRGIGSEVMRFCIDKARAEAYKAIRLDVIPDNEPAKALFRKHGFQYADDADMGLGSKGIPLFSLYELNLL